MCLDSIQKFRLANESRSLYERVIEQRDSSLFGRRSNFCVSGTVRAFFTSCITIDAITPDTIFFSVKPHT